MHTFLDENFSGGFKNWRLVVLHYVAKALGVLVHVEGFPYGSRRNFDMSEREGWGGACRDGEFIRYAGYKSLELQ